jgi:hypothetical protein
MDPLKNFWYRGMPSIASHPNISTLSRGRDPEKAGVRSDNTYI